VQKCIECDKLVVSVGAHQLLCKTVTLTAFLAWLASACQCHAPRFWLPTLASQPSARLGISVPFVSLAVCLCILGMENGSSCHHSR